MPEAIASIRRFAEFEPHWIEEPTSPDDVLGHAAIAQAVAPIRIATGEHCQNRVMFKQLFQAKALHYCQLDAYRLGGLSQARRHEQQCRRNDLRHLRFTLGFETR